MPVPLLEFQRSLFRTDKIRRVYRNIRQYLYCKWRIVNAHPALSDSDCFGLVLMKLCYVMDGRLIHETSPT